MKEEIRNSIIASLLISIGLFLMVLAPNGWGLIGVMMVSMSMLAYMFNLAYYIAFPNGRKV